jgi:DNA-binding XRE family transcriptional regulator
MRRKMLAMTQTELGNALGLTFQQVQKYEKTLVGDTVRGCPYWACGTQH